MISVCMFGELQLDELGGRERPAELLAVERVLARGVPAELGRAQRAPGDAVARAVEAAERPLAGRSRPGRSWLLGHEHLVHHDLAGDRGAQAELALDLGRARAPSCPSPGRSRGPAPSSSLAQTTKTSAIGELVIHVLEPLSTQPPGTFSRPRLHAAGIGAGVGLGEAEAADELAGREPRQVLLRAAPRCRTRGSGTSRGSTARSSRSGSRESTRSISRAMRP